MKNYTILLLLFSIFFFSCEEENLNNIAENQFVVEAFLYKGEPVEDIRIKTTFPLTDVEDTSMPINDAVVTLKRSGESYSLLSSGNEGYYHYPLDDLTVNTGDEFLLEVIYNGITATAETKVPTPTEGLSLSVDSLKVPQLPFSEGREAIEMAIRNFLLNSTIEATWNNPNEDLYFMVVESVSDTLDPIFPGQVIEALKDFRFVSAPTNESALTFLGGALESFGIYSVKIYHINREYAALYENQEQDSRDLNEPPSNVQNALGIFSAFNSQEVFFEVVRE